jgi:serine phosphatase RsbU (regulator of sigma subunit)
MRFVLTYEGQIHHADLDEGAHLVGRGPDTDLQIPVRTVSGHHARLRIEGERVFIEDLGSTNGTDIDGATLTPSQGEVELPSGRTVRFAGVPLWREENSSGEPPQDTHTGASIMTRLSADEGLLTRSLFQVGQQGFSERAQTRITQMLGSLFELIASDESDQEMGIRACHFVSHWVDADRVVLLEDSGEGTMPEPTAQWLRGEDGGERLRLSNTLVDKVLNDHAAVLVSDASADANFKASESIVALNLRSAMAAPLFDNQRVRGILYVDSARSGIRYGEDELQVLSATANAVAVKMRNQSLEKEIRTAARIQTAMLPEELPELPGFELLAHLDMCRGVGGDLYNFLPRKSGSTLVALGDVTGKGTPAALAMSACMVLLSALAEILEDLEQLGDVLHRKLYESLSAEQFVTLFAGDLNPQSGTLVYLNAGHEPPLVVREDGTIDECPSAGQPMGLLPSNSVKKQEMQFRAGDLMAIFSDGIPEATRDGENLMGLDVVKDLLKEMRNAPLGDIRDAILKKVTDYLAGRHSSDDITLILLRRNA